MSHRWATEFPDLGTGPVSIEPYISPEHFELERERIFKRTWLNVGRIDDVPEPGSYFVRELEVCRTSVLITHGNDGEIRAFHNVCSHRGNKLVWGDRGKCKGYLSCCFHGWTYGLDGKLVSVLDEKSFFDIDKDTLGLTPIAAGVWKGYIFVNLAEEPEETLEEYLGGVVDHFADASFDGVHLTFRYDVEEATNWKVALDSQNEIYHLPVLGPVHSAFSGFFTMDDDGCTRITDFRRFGPHLVFSTDFNESYESIGAEPLMNTIETSDTGLPEQLGVFDFWVLFPNTVIAFLPGVMYTYNFWPLAYDRTVWEIRVMFPKAKDAAELLGQHYLKAKLRDALAEDIAGHEQVFAGMLQQAKKVIHLQDDEAPIRFFYETVQRYMHAGEAQHA